MCYLGLCVYIQELYCASVHNATGIVLIEAMRHVGLPALEFLQYAWHPTVSQPPLYALPTLPCAYRHMRTLSTSEPHSHAICTHEHTRSLKACAYCKAQGCAYLRRQERRQAPCSCIPSVQSHAQNQVADHHSPASSQRLWNSSRATRVAASFTICRHGQDRGIS